MEYQVESRPYGVAARMPSGSIVRHSFLAAIGLVLFGACTPPEADAPPNAKVSEQQASIAPPSTQPLHTTSQSCVEANAKFSPAASVPVDPRFETDLRRTNYPDDANLLVAPIDIFNDGSKALVLIGRAYEAGGTLKLRLPAISIWSGSVGDRARSPDEMVKAMIDSPKAARQRVIERIDAAFQLDADGVDFPLLEGSGLQIGFVDGGAVLRLDAIPAPGSSVDGEWRAFLAISPDWTAHVICFDQIKG